MSGTANLASTYTATEELRKDLGTDMASAFIARSFRNAGMTDATPEFVAKLHDANRLVVQGKVDILGDIQTATQRSDIVVHGSKPVANPAPASSNDQDQAAA